MFSFLTGNDEKKQKTNHHSQHFCGKTQPQSTPQTSPHVSSEPLKIYGIIGSPSDSVGHEYMGTIAPYSILEKLYDNIPPIINPPSHYGSEECGDIRAPTNRRSMYLLFSSARDGKSFSRMISAISGKGPTLIVISASCDEKCKVHFMGGYTEESWLTVSGREKKGRSENAAAARALRLEQEYNTVKAINQDTQYFGNDRCYVFKATAKDGNGRGTGCCPTLQIDDVQIYKGKGSKHNYMYLSDTHPDNSRIGIGMGGKVGTWTWFIDRWLEQGSSNRYTEGKPLERCQTFNTLIIGPSAVWDIISVEVFAVEKGMVNMLCKEHGVDGTVVKTGDSILKKDGADVDMAILELNNQHTFMDNEVYKECCMELR